MQGGNTYTVVVREGSKVTFSSRIVALKIDPSRGHVHFRDAAVTPDGIILIVWEKDECLYSGVVMQKENGDRSLITTKLLALFLHSGPPWLQAVKIDLLPPGDAGLCAVRAEFFPRNGANERENKPSDAETFVLKFEQETQKVEWVDASGRRVDLVPKQVLKPGQPEAQ
jgi:hypothetical protein